jgi:hypothetical protein
LALVRGTHFALFLFSSHPHSAHRTLR